MTQDVRVFEAIGILNAYGDIPEPTVVDYEFLVYQLRQALEKP